FVETVGGDLTVKIEDNTDTGEGIYVESVTHHDQTLDDAAIFYTSIGSLILLKILPYQEKHWRYLVFNEKLGTVTRVDSIANSCVLLPEDHGIIFSDGYHLRTGETKRFDSGLTDMLFERRVASPNGEDHLYVFYNRLTGVYVLMAYNIITRRVETPIVCHGYSVFRNGELVYFRANDEPQKHHVLQVWRTPFMEGEFRAGEKTASHLYKIGNADVVRCMAECHEVLNLIAREDTYADLYVDLAKTAGDITDAYFWTAHPEAFELKPVLLEIKGAAESAIAEFDKVRRIRRATADESARVAQAARKAATAARNTRPDDIMGFVHRLSELRAVRGEIVGLRDLRYSDGDAIDALESENAEATGHVSEHCVEFLLKPEALDPYRSQVNGHADAVDSVAKVAGADEVEAALTRTGGELEMLIDIVGNLKIADATQTTQIVEDISTIYATLNQVRAALKNRRRELFRVEGAAQFGAQVKLIDQAIVNYLDLCDAPEKCEEYLSKTMVQLEELEGRFADFDEYVEQLAEKRDEVYNAFESRRLQLVEQRNRRAGSLEKSAGRVLTTIRHRLDRFETVAEIHGYLAADLMVEKVRDIVARLEELGDSVKAGDIQTRLKTLREDAVRQLRDRQELFVDGGDILQLGNHKFSVNRQELELTIVPRDGRMCFHLAGTGFFEPVTDPEFLATEPVWDQECVSENADVYRAETLAWQLLRALESPTPPEGIDTAAWLALEETDRLAAVQRFMAPRYAEGYTKGVHDRDAASILASLAETHLAAGLLRHTPEERALALLFWLAEGDERIEKKARALGLLRRVFAGAGAPEAHVAGLRDTIEAFRRTLERSSPVLHGADPGEAALYLFREWLDETAIAISPAAAELVKEFRRILTAKRLEKSFENALSPFEDDPVGRFEVVRDWLEGVLRPNRVESPTQPCLVEAAVHLVRGEFELTAVKHLALTAELSGLAGSHPRVEGGVYRFDYHDLARRMRRFEAEVVPPFVAYQKRKVALIEERRGAMRLDEFKPRVMSSFVRNRLLDRVYLPLIGSNLAKQLGTAGEDTRTDRMGLLLLISPPGYGKTTLMEYVANRLGLTFVKINGPALGHDVKSLDPEDAPNAGAREEIHRLNLALEMGDNVMIYLDDIQHTNPELLQKFISLCDAQRKIEGVWNGRPRTHDLRGKRVCVVMAGNPYTESGGKFQIPDMLANRADTHNLGDIVGGHADAFEDSYVENSLTSNPVLGRLAARGQGDVFAVMRVAATGSREGVDFEGNYTMEEIDELVSVMKKLMRVRDTILRVNREYIRSAAMEEAYRTEPAFRLQGSYRNMNRIAEKILPIMTDAEVVAAIGDHYESEAQTLTRGAEANLLKFRELEGALTEPESERWTEIKRRFGRNQLIGGAGEHDPVTRVVGAMSGFAEGLSRIEQVLTRARDDRLAPATLADVTVEKLETIIENLRAVPVNVEIKVVPVHEGEEAPAASPPEPANKKRAPKKIPGKARNLPVDVETDVEQGD
ncbi:MAG: DNA repair ATPase, partial [Verrucomicrobiae bacterium]|nr:DNA repair ATPase [Verrucomicrobiae bacterium]